LNWLPAGGWLASNDGALEVADFIHLSDGGLPTLTPVHAKAAANNAANRALAVSPYELVVSQAIKNLRHADPILAADEFMNRLGRQIQMPSGTTAFRRHAKPCSRRYTHTEQTCAVG